MADAQLSTIAQGALVAYFSMEVALQSDVPTYTGGLGVLAGDMLRSAADMGLPMVGVSLLYRKGHFFQTLDEQGRQHEEPVAWSPDDWLEVAEASCKLDIEGRQVAVRAWRYPIAGISGRPVPVFLLDTNMPENSEYDRSLTDRLYGGDLRYRLCQEVVLGIGGVRMLRALGLTEVASFHLNEGHSSLLALELFAEELKRSNGDREVALKRVKRKCVFTTHTPVPAGRDRFSLELARSVLGDERMHALDVLGCCGDMLRMTRTALNLSHYVNGVTERHGEISRSMFPGYPIDSITNGVHSATWTSPPFQAVYDRYLPEWRRNFISLRYASHLPLEAIRQAHHEAKAHLMSVINRLTNVGFDSHVFTIGFARRAAAYKRSTLLFRDPERIRRIASSRPIQLVFAGKAHPADQEGKAVIQEIVRWQKELGSKPAIVYLPNYDMHLAQLVTAGTDLWLNTPQPPFEASGTSGMKAAHNGVPSLSILDGWWREGWVEGITGWAIGPRDRPAERGDNEDAEDLYRALEEKILPIFYEQPDRWTEIMRSTIALNASVFNTDRMLHEYFVKAYEEQYRAHEE
ncbi:MAG: alpha-glucan family phosphorylase [Candidatus Binataceae bacterium]